jgi:hypothetical protein
MRSGCLNLVFVLVAASVATALTAAGVADGDRDGPQVSGGPNRRLLLRARGPKRLARPEGEPPDGGIRGGGTERTGFRRERRALNGEAAGADGRRESRL